MIPVMEAELSTMLVYTARYALGRQSTAPSAASDLLRTYGVHLQEWQRLQIREDIERAIGMGCAGAECDVRTWREVQAVLERQGRAAPGEGG